MELDPTNPRATPAAEELESTHRREGTLVGQVIGGRYRLEARLATGGMGEVYRATHVELGRSLALKLMRPELSGDPSFVERFRREAMTASRLGHPHIVDIIDSGSEGGRFYFVMEFLDGKTLSSLISGGPISLPLALDLTTQIAEALDVAHRAGVVHRDLKPDNVIVLARERGPFVKLVDFGIAKVVALSPDQKQTTHGVIMGTPQYMAPEQAAGVALDARADIYALGLILFELLTGHPPLTGQTAPLVMSAHIAQVPPELPTRFPAVLRALVAKMLAKRPGDRPESMRRVLEVLATTPRKTTGSFRVPALLAAGVVLVAVGFALSSPSPRGAEGRGEGSRETAPPVAKVVKEPEPVPVPIAVAPPAVDAGRAPEPALLPVIKKKPRTTVPGLLPADGL